MPIETWLAFVAAPLVLALIPGPGPGVATIVGFAFDSGHRVVLAAITDTGYALAASRAVSLLNPARRRWIERAGSGVPIAAGVATAAVRR